jgi:FkbM family methyltransferase
MNASPLIFKTENGPRAGRTFRRWLQVQLARRPHRYAALLRAAGRGSPEKFVSLALVPRGGTVLDIGANAGYFTLLFSDLVGPDGRVHAFEPVPPTHAAISASMARESWFRNVWVHGVAVSDTSCDVTIQVPGDDTGQASLVRQAEGSWARAAVVTTYQVRAVRLDEYLPATEPIHFVKCDVEGAELPALRGMQALLARWQPLLMLEVCPAWMRGFGYGSESLFTFLGGMGYDRFLEVAEPLRFLGDSTAAARDAALPDSANVICATARHQGQLQRWCRHESADPSPSMHSTESSRQG